MVVTRATRKREHDDSAVAIPTSSECEFGDVNRSDVEHKVVGEQTQSNAKRQKKDPDPCPPLKRRDRVLMPLNLDNKQNNINTAVTSARPYGRTTRSRSNAASEQAVARVVSENPSTKRARVTRTATISSTIDHATKKNKQYNAEPRPPASHSFRNQTGVPIKTPASSESIPKSGNDATSTHKPQRRYSNDGGNETGVDAIMSKKRHGVNSTVKSNHDYTKHYQHNGNVDDIDARDHDDPQSVTDYVRDIYDHYREREEVTTVLKTQLATQQQPHITERMRAILVDWLLEVHYKFKLCQQTLYLAISVLDRFLNMSSEPVKRRELQLVGITSLLVAAKYEELFVPELRDLAYICDGAYTEAQVGG
jgi:hypothetical protein